MTNTLIPALTIALISNHQVMVLGLQKLIESRETPRMLVHQYNRLTEILDLETMTDIFILDIETERDSLGAIKQMREAAPHSKLLLLSGFEDKERMRDAVEYGVDGVILKIQPPMVMLAAIDALHSPMRHHRLVEEIERNRTTAVSRRKILSANSDKESQSVVWPDALTEREREVIGLVRQGLSNKDIAYRLSISDSTVRHHLTNIFDKVGVPNRQKLLVHAHSIHSTLD